MFHRILIFIHALCQLKERTVQQGWWRSQDSKLDTIANKLLNPMIQQVDPTGRSIKSVDALWVNCRCIERWQSPRMMVCNVGQFLQS